MVLLFGADKWVISKPMVQRLEGAHVGFLRQVTREKANNLRDGSWRQDTAKKVLQGAGTHPLWTYVYRRQETVVEWVALQMILDFFAIYGL